MELLEFAGSDLGVQDDRGLDRFNRVEVVVLVELVDEGNLARNEKEATNLQLGGETSQLRDQLTSCQLT